MRSYTKLQYRLRQLFIAGLLLSSGYALAIDGILSIGDKNRRATVFSTIRRDLNVSLGSGMYHYRSSRALPSISQAQAKGSNSMVIYHRGNVSIHIPVRGKASILHSFKTPAPPTLR